MFSRPLMITVLVILFCTAALAEEPLTLEERYADTGINFHYPTTWALQVMSDDLILLANSQEALDAPRQRFKSGYLKVAIFKTLNRTLGLPNVAQTPYEILSVVARNSSSSQQFKQALEHAFSGRAAASLDFTDEVSSLDGMLVLVRLENGEIATLLASTPLAELAAVQHLVMQIAATLSAPTVAAQTDLAISASTRFTTQDHQFAFKHPREWLPVEEEGLVFIVPDKRILDYSDFRELQQGDFLIIVYPRLETISGFPETIAGEHTLLMVTEYMSSVSRSWGYHQAALEPIEAGTLSGWQLSAARGRDELWLAAVSLGDDTAVIAVFALRGQIESLRPVLVDMLASFERGGGPVAAGFDAAVKAGK